METPVFCPQSTACSWTSESWAQGRGSLLQASFWGWVAGSPWYQHGQARALLAADFLLGPHGWRSSGLSGVSRKAPLPAERPPLWPVHLPKAPPSVITLGIRVSPDECGGHKPAEVILGRDLPFCAFLGLTQVEIFPCSLPTRRGALRMLTARFLS